MPQTLVQLFGARAVRSGSKVTIEFADFASTGLGNPTTASPSKLAAAYLKFLRESTKPMQEDATAGVVADSFDATRSFTTRNNVNQIQNPITFNVYTPDTTREFDPDAVY